VSESGFGLRYSIVEQLDLKATGLSHAKRHDSYSDFDLLDANLELLSRFISECNDIGVEIFLFTPPAAEYYTENLDARQLSVMGSAISDLANSHSNVQYFDFLSDARFTDDDFKDADHLAGPGARKLTEIIDQLIND
jgi:hypothetical protein